MNDQLPDWQPPELPRVPDDATSTVGTTKDATAGQSEAATQPHAAPESSKQYPGLLPSYVPVKPEVGKARGTALLSCFGAIAIFVLIFSWIMSKLHGYY